MAFRAGLSLFLAAATALAGCDLPRDPERTSEVVAGGELVAGKIAGRDAAFARERAVLEAAAAHFSANLRIVEADIHELVDELEDGRIQIISGALPKNTPFASRLGLTKPLREDDGDSDTFVLAIRRGENAFLMTLNAIIAVTPEQ